MQEITFEKGNEQHLKDCKDALCRSTLGEKNFSSPGSAESVILEGICQGNLYVALIGEECVGFTYLFSEKGLHTVYASFFAGNDASRRVMEKCGMTYDHFSAKELTYLGKERDLTYYVIHRKTTEDKKGAIISC